LRCRHALPWRAVGSFVRAGGSTWTRVDQAVRRVLRLKMELRLLDDGWNPASQACITMRWTWTHPLTGRAPATSPSGASLLLANPVGVLPLRSNVRSVAIVGPLADDSAFFLGCYSFQNNVLPAFPELGTGLDALPSSRVYVPSPPGVTVEHEWGCHLTDDGRSGLAAATAAARAAAGLRHGGGRPRRAVRTREVRAATPGSH
jgi:beta-xylosidase